MRIGLYGENEPCCYRGIQNRRGGSIPTLLVLGELHRSHQSLQNLMIRHLLF
jgi:hypothetical protein